MMKDLFNYNSKQELLFGDLNLHEITGEINKPTYLYSRKILTDRLDFFIKTVLKDAPNAGIFFAMKSNHFNQILNIIKDHSLGVDVVSGGELKKALEVGFSPKKIIFSGVGKSVAELELAVQSQIFQINIENFDELIRLEKLTQQFSKNISVGLRLNLNVDAKTHPKITTGLKENKFGLSWPDYLKARDFLFNHPRIQLAGLTLHLGSQISNFTGFEKAFKILEKEYADLEKRGFHLTTLDVGGGIGIDYHGSVTQDLKYLKSWCQKLKKLKFFKGQILTEPGRFLSARCGVLLAQVEYIKINPKKNFLILNSGMNHFMRPALYDSFHKISLVKKNKSPQKKFDIVGPVCESSDVLGVSRSLPTPKPGDWIAIHDCGAYGSSMSNQYNLFDPPGEVLI